ncbi:MAG TPA: hypothetical protein VLE73_03470 [Candidatus Saccharimonadales bacterium]|nr:hypothetical protein [Candidatus Saccharimonadales bacterium]
MKHNDAAKHHTKRPHTVHRTSSAAHANASGKKVFDVMRPGKAPASPTSRPVIANRETGAQKNQVTVSGIGEAAPVAAKPRTISDVAPTVSADQVHAAQVAAAASASLVAAPSTDPGDVPAGAPPVAVPVNDLPVAVTSSAAPSVEVTGKPKVTEAPKDPEPKPAPPPDLVPESSAADASRSMTHGKTIMPLSQAQADQSPADSAVDTSAQTPPPAPTLAAKAPEVPEPAGETPPPVEASTKEAETESAHDEPAEVPEKDDKKQVDAKAPTEPKQPAVPELHPQDIQDIVVSHHATSVWWHTVLLLLLVVLLAVVALDILLDADIISSPIQGIPYTDFL